MMKLVKILFFTLLSIASINLFAQSKSYTINGQISAKGVSKLYFTEGNFFGQDNGKAKEVEVKAGKFSISGNFKEPIPVFLSLSETLQPGTDDVIQFILDEGTINVKVQDKLKSAKVTGSAANDGAQKLKSGQIKFETEFARLNEAAQAEAQSGIPVDSLQRKYGPLFANVQNEMLDYQQNFVRANKNAFISMLVITDLVRTTQNYIEADSLFNSLDPKITSGASAKQIGNFIKSNKKTSIGAMAPDFSLADTTGKKVALSSLRGKYVLLDFWASWCKPCRDENPNIVQAYQDFNGKGFTVLGVSLDREKKNWLQAINADELTWNHVSDLKFWSSEAAVLYGVGSIPANFLLDPKGKIIGRNLRGPALQDKLKEIFR
ncbi:MAG: TlpA disulfide reductase family protein [Daejeonella sp.]